MVILYINNLVDILRTLTETLIVIPARGGSKRLKGKNKVLLNGIPLFMHSVKAAKRIEGKLRIIISTDDEDILNYCIKEKIETQERSKILALDYSPKQDVIIDVCKELWEKEFYIPEVIISLQANSPEVDDVLLIKNIETFEKLPTINGCKELVCINSNGKQNGSIRIMTYKTVFQKTLSTYLGTFTKDLVDIHTLSDLNLVEK